MSINSKADRNIASKNNVLLRRAMLRTLEAVIAIGLMLTVLATMTHKTSVADPRETIGVLAILENDDAFRNCVVSNSSCAYDFIDGFVPDKYDYNITISSDVNYILEGLPENKYVSSESLFVAGNSTYYNYTIVRLYYWTR